MSDKGLASVVARRMRPPDDLKPQKLASRPEVADFLGVPTKTLDRWAHQKLGPPYRIVGRHAKYAWPDVQRWLAEQKSGGGVA